jgi:hypothetical protein
VGSGRRESLPLGVRDHAEAFERPRAEYREIAGPGEDHLIDGLETGGAKEGGATVSPSAIIKDWSFLATVTPAFSRIGSGIQVNSDPVSTSIFSTGMNCFGVSIPATSPGT